MKKVVTFINMKGGVGKTTLAVNVGHTLSKKFNKKVLLIDIDPQMNATQYVLDQRQVQTILENPKQTIYGILEKKPLLPAVVSPEKKQEPTQFEGLFKVDTNFFIIPSHLKIMEIVESVNLEKLNKYLEKHFADKFDVIIIDSPPTISVYTKIALLASNYYIVPMTTDYLSFFGLPLLENYIQDLKEDYELDLEFLGIILNQVRPTFTIYSTIKSKIKEQAQWATKLFDNELKETTIITNAISQRNINSQSQYITELNNEEIKGQIVNITQEVMRKMRL